MGHLRTLKILNFVMSAFSALIGLLFLALFVLPGLMACRDGEEMGLLFILSGLAVTALLVGISAAHWVVGQLVGVGRGRVAQTVLALVQVSTVPLGTVYALYALYVCWLDEPSKKAFESPLKKPIA